jgi:xanthine dehydrogenase accessory factor
MDLKGAIVLIKGGGEVASAIAHRLFQSGFKICLTEIPYPLAVHRGTTFCEAVFEGEKTVEGISAKLVKSFGQIPTTWNEHKIPIIVDEQAKSREYIKPKIVIDATMMKKNLFTNIKEAELVLGIGPGFIAGKDVHLVVESYHNEYLGKVIDNGTALPDNAIPMSIGGYTFERAIHAEQAGKFTSFKELGDTIRKGEIIATVNEEKIKASINGMLRGILRTNLEVKKGVKLIEIDPESDKEVCFIIRSKMRAIAGGVLEAIMYYFNKK